VVCEGDTDDPCHGYHCEHDPTDTDWYNSYNCVADSGSLPGCCESDTDCPPCAGALTSDGGCCTPVCGDDGSGVGYNVCFHQNEPPGKACTDIDPAQYPPNCFEGFCGQTVLGTGNGVCEPSQHPAYNNLCSDAFVAGEPTIVDTGWDGWIGKFQKTDPSGAKLEVSGATTCANNNYESMGPDCIEDDWSKAPLGKTGPDLVYVFQYPTNAADEYILWSYLVKVQADFDVGVYVVEDIDEAAAHVARLEAREEAEADLALQPE